jgi:hypothetical protein
LETIINGVFAAATAKDKNVSAGFTRHQVITAPAADRIIPQTAQNFIVVVAAVNRVVVLIAFKIVVAFVTAQ